MVRTVKSVCSHDCPDSCGVLISVDEQGRATKIAGDPSHPVTRGFLCAKVAKYLDRVCSPDRLLFPLRRKAGVPKGPLPPGEQAKAFERIEWDQALDQIADKFGAICRTHGSESILPYSYAGTIGVLGYGSMDRRFFHRLGASQLDRTICSSTGGEALVSVYGKKLGTPPEHFQSSRYIIAWGANIHGNNIHLWPFIEQARRKGAKLVVIDPYSTRTARLADWHLRIHPGSDAALALGMMHVILREGLHDRAYIEEQTHGFQQLSEHVKSYTPERVAEWSGIPAGMVERLAREYAGMPPAVIRLNYGVQRSENGGAAVRAICMLPALIGAWRHVGGGLQLSTSGAFTFNKDALERPGLMLKSPLGRPARVVNMSRLGHALTELGSAPGDGPPVTGLFVYNSNPAAVAPNQGAVTRGLMRSDLFTVVHDQFLTDTTDYADIVLPATTFFEQKDFQGAYGHYYLQLSEAAIEPLGEARSNVWLFSEMARRMGYTESCFGDTVDDMIRQALETGHDEGKRTPDLPISNPAVPDTPIPNPAIQGVTFERLQAEKCVLIPLPKNAGEDFSVPFARGALATPSGKVEFYSEALSARGLDPLPTFHAPEESRNGSGAARYPLEFLPRKADNFMNSTFANIPSCQKMEEARAPFLEIHAEDAAPRQVQNGDWVEVFNDRGRILLQALVNENVPRGVVAAGLNWSKLSKGGINVNALTSERLTDLGGGATFYSTLVEVQRLDRA